MTDTIGSHICEAAGCSENATEAIALKVGSLGVISLVVCSNCVTKFQEAEQHD